MLHESSTKWDVYLSLLGLVDVGSRSYTRKPSFKFNTRCFVFLFRRQSNDVYNRQYRPLFYFLCTGHMHRVS